MTLSQTRRVLPYLLLLPAFIFILVVLVYPLAFSFHTMLFKWNYAHPELGKVFVGLGNFVKIAHDKAFGQSLKNTIVYSLGTVGVSFLLGFGLALLVNKPFRGRSFIRVVMMLPVFLVPVVIALLWRVMYNGQFGLIAWILQVLGVLEKGNSPLAIPNVAMLSVMIVNIWQIAPFFFLVLVSGLQSIPLEQYEGAKIDGANSWQELLYITLPWLRPVVVVVLLITLIDAFKVFDLVYILTGGGPGNRTEVMSYYIYRQSFQLFQVGYGSALAFVAFTIEALIALVFLGVVRNQSAT
jgi:multiple sugar transport system permease protein